MPDDPTPPRRPFGERDAEDRMLPFGERPPARRPDDTPRAAPEPDSSLPEVEEVDPDRIPAFRPNGFDPADGDLDLFLERASTPDRDLDDTPFVPASGEPQDDEEAADAPEPPVGDEPRDAPMTIQARSQRRRGMTDSGVLKRPKGPTFRSYPEQEAAEAAQAAAESAAQAAALRVAGGLKLRVIFSTLFTVFMTAVVFATLFTWWTPNAFLPAESVDRLSVALATATAARVSFVPTLTPVGMQPPPGTLPPAATKIGIVSGHRGNHPATGLPDPGAVCADGLTTEQAIVEVVAEETAELLRGHGYQVEVLDEWDARLPGYSAAAMVSIHADSCEYINDFATGFKVASFVGSQTLEQDAKLVSCLITRYAETTGMPFHPSVTRDMTEYHTFAEVGRGTPGAIIEIGFLYLDRQTLTEHPDVIALGVARGVLCYLRAEEIAPENIATPSPEP